MSLDIDDQAIAERIRAILGGPDPSSIEAAALRLGVSEVALRISLHPHEAHPTVEVITAIVRHHGVDPSWLISGQYDSATHRAALGDAAEITRSQVLRLVSQQLTPRSVPAQVLPNLEREA